MNGIVFISLLLNAVCLYFIFLLWKKVEENHKNKDSTEQMEEMMELFSQEMKYENEQIYKLISDFRNNMEYDKQEIHDTTNENKTDLNIYLNDEKRREDEGSFGWKTTPDTNQVIILANKGYNAEEIAKIMNRGKGEIELLLKFYA
ncbi:DUF6115 domain-containing protein [Fictibacillus phosphorivorans]|uniref:DUF6115 domain-containing protein n=1 Tax=Fictibacillus phosphorivorans TaxID=1221500 RepID=UPI002041215D|nr:hypothetical protein [Fictibacillus phosphorivorans]MCM3717133.1 hypothetical protein [Fictibacillus phosphorivorans]MCM3774820.1 hypothetical protein [Fictibacillus phosphorivorans]